MHWSEKTQLLILKSPNSLRASRALEWHFSMYVKNSSSPHLACVLNSLVSTLILESRANFFTGRHLSYWELGEGNQASWYSDLSSWIKTDSWSGEDYCCYQRSRKYQGKAHILLNTSWHTHICILPPSYFVCPLFHFGMSQNIVLFLKIKIINLLIFLLYPY